MASAARGGTPNLTRDPLRLVQRTHVLGREPMAHAVQDRPLLRPRGPPAAEMEEELEAEDIAGPALDRDYLRFNVPNEKVKTAQARFWKDRKSRPQGHLRYPVCASTLEKGRAAGSMSTQAP